MCCTEKRHLHEAGKQAVCAWGEGGSRNRENLLKGSIFVGGERNNCGNSIGGKPRTEAGQKGAPMSADKRPLRPLTAVFIGCNLLLPALLASTQESAASCPAGAVSIELSRGRLQGVIDGPVVDAPASRFHLSPPSLVSFPPVPECPRSRFS